MLFGSSLRAAIPCSASRLDMNWRGEAYATLLPHQLFCWNRGLRRGIGA
jgi:hypothetical protein